MKDYPFVTAMIVAKNEEKYIEKCFSSLLKQSYPANKYEILIIDGLSDDKTLTIAKEVEKEYTYKAISSGQDKVEVRYFINEKKLLAAGWNLGIKEARGEYVVRIDAHGYADKDFILKSVQTILNIDDAVCVGGAMKTEALSEKGKMIASILSSPFGVGNSKFRYSKKCQYVDTVAFGLYKKNIFMNVGYFDESLKRNQDNDMHRRIRENGGRFYLNPEIKTTYHPRETIRSMMKQAFQNGKWNIITFKKNRNSLSVRHIVPLSFVLAILSMSIGGFIYRPFWNLLFLILTIYFILGFIFSVLKEKNLIKIFIMPLVFFLLHLSYGVGSVISVGYLLKLDKC